MKFDRSKGILTNSREEIEKRAVETKENTFLYKELGFPSPYSSITYEENLIFTRYAKKYYTEESVEAVKSIIEKEMSLLSIGKITKSLLLDLGNAVDVYQLAYLMLRYVKERGYSTSKLLTSYDCQKAMLQYHSSEEWGENFDTDLAVVMINGGKTVIPYIQTLFQERARRGKKTIMFLTNKSSLGQALRDLAKTEANPLNATYVGLVNLEDVDFYEVLEEDVLNSSKKDFNELYASKTISKKSGGESSKELREPLSTNLLHGTNFN